MDVNKYEWRWERNRGGYDGVGGTVKNNITTLENKAKEITH